MINQAFSTPALEAVIRRTVTEHQLTSITLPSILLTFTSFPCIHSSCNLHNEGHRTALCTVVGNYPTLSVDLLPGKSSMTPWYKYQIHCTQTSTNWVEGSEHNTADGSLALHNERRPCCLSCILHTPACNEKIFEITPIVFPSTPS